MKLYLELIILLPLILGGIILVSIVALAAAPSRVLAAEQVVSIREFAVTLFSKYGVAIEIISMQLLFAVVGALYLGRRRKP